MPHRSPRSPSLPKPQTWGSDTVKVPEHSSLILRWQPSITCLNSWLACHQRYLWHGDTVLPLSGFSMAQLDLFLTFSHTAVIHSSSFNPCGQPPVCVLLVPRCLWCLMKQKADMKRERLSLSETPGTAATAQMRCTHLAPEVAEVQESHSCLFLRWVFPSYLIFFLKTSFPCGPS